MICPQIEIEVKLNGVPIEKSSCERFLGVLVDDSLSWVNHIKCLASKISRNSGIIYKLKGIVSEAVLMTLYYSFVQSHLNYCSSRYGVFAQKIPLNPFLGHKKRLFVLLKTVSIIIFIIKKQVNVPVTLKKFLREINC